MCETREGLCNGEVVRDTRERGFKAGGNAPMEMLISCLPLSTSIKLSIFIYISVCKTASGDSKEIIFQFTSVAGRHVSVYLSVCLSVSCFIRDFCFSRL